MGYVFTILVTMGVTSALIAAAEHWFPLEKRKTKRKVNQDDYYNHCSGCWRG